MRRPTVLFALALVVAASATATARAQAPAAPAPAVTPAPAQMAAKLYNVGGARAMALMESRLVVRGTTTAYAPGQTIVVRAYVERDKRWAKRVLLQPGANGGGSFAVSYRPRTPGRLVVRVEHPATPELAALSARTAAVEVLPRRVTPRSGRRSIRLLQRKLRAHGYVTGSPGAFDGRTARAVLAFRKVTGMARTTNASIEVMRAIVRGKGRFVIKRPEHGRHIEADLSRQVIALISGGRVQRIYPVSSGAPSTPTVIGSFKVYSKTPGTNAKGMVHSAYFIGGYATHGYPSVPVFPASHGCLRVPIPDARSLFNWIDIGTPVDVYR